MANFRRKRLFVLSTLAFVYGGIGAASTVAQKPEKQLISVGDVTTALSRLPQPAELIAKAESAANNIHNIFLSLESDKKRLERLDNSISDVNKQIDDLTAKRSEVLRDFQQGLFCSTCHRAMSEFPSAAEFWAHIQEGASEGRRAVPATQEQIDAKKKEFDDAMAALVAKKRSISNERQELLDGMSVKWKDIQTGFTFWQTAISFAHEAADYEGREKIDAIDAAINRVDTLRAKTTAVLDTLRTQDNPNPSSIAVAMQMRDAWKKESDALLSERSDALRTSAQVQQNLEDHANSQYGHLVSDMRSYEGIPDITLPALHISIDRVVVDTDPHSIEYRFRYFTGVVAGLRASTTETDTNVQVFIDLASSYRVGVAYITSLTRNGITSNYVPIFQPLSEKRDPVTNLPSP